MNFPSQRSASLPVVPVALLALALGATLPAAHAQTPGGLVAGQNLNPRPTGPNTQPTLSPNGSYQNGQPIAINTEATVPFAYAAAAGDTALAKGDDLSQSTASTWTGQGPEGSSLVMRFSGQSYGGLFVNTNGILSFRAGRPTHTAAAITTLTTPAIAPFWADVDTRNSATGSLPSGNVWYRTTQNAAQLTAIAATVNGSFLISPNFNPTFAQVVTWENVGFYAVNGSDNTRVSTFQAVVASDGVRTYSLFLYPDRGIWWDRGPISPAGSFATYGWATGDGSTGFDGQGSGTTAMRDLWFLTNTTPSNPGTIAYNVGGTLAPLVVAANLTLPSTQGTATQALQLSANAAGHTLTGTAAVGSLQFNQLLLDQPTDAVSFTGNLVTLANASGAIVNGTLTFADSAVLVARVAGAVNGGAPTLKNNARIAIYAAGATTAATALTFDRTGALVGQRGGTLDLRNFNTAIGTLASVGTAAGLVTNSLTSTATLTLGSTASASFNGVIQNGAGVLALVKTGTGTQTLTGTNTYTGTTAVNAGSLIVNGNNTGATGAVSITSGATLGGNGTVGGATTIHSGGIMTPGNGPGVLAFTGALSLSSGSLSNFEITSGVRGTGYDGINVGGNLTYGGTLSVAFSVPATAGTYSLFAPAVLPSGSFGAINLTGSHGLALTRAGGVWTGSNSGFNFTFTESTGNLVVGSALSAFQSWRQTYFSITGNTGNATDTFDFDNDGLSNLLEYATGSNPTVASPAPARVNRNSGGFLTITFEAVADAAITYTVEGSSNLTGAWSSVFSATGTTLGAGPQTIADTTLPGTRRFLRLRVSY